MKKFKDYCLETSEIITNKYSWYIMPPTLHKLLEHSHQVQEILDLPLGMYKEESLKKVARDARLSHTCKVSRKNAVTNQVHYLLLCSDPVISSTKFKKSKIFARVDLEEDVVALLMTDK